MLIECSVPVIKKHTKNDLHIGASFTYIQTFYMGVIYHPCFNYNGRITQLPLKLRHGWIIASRYLRGCRWHSYMGRGMNQGMCYHQMMPDHHRKLHQQRRWQWCISMQVFRLFLPPTKRHYMSPTIADEILPHFKGHSGTGCATADPN